MKNLLEQIIGFNANSIRGMHGFTGVDTNIGNRPTGPIRRTAWSCRLAAYLCVVTGWLLAAQGLPGQVAACYDPNVISYYYSLSTQLDDARPTFYVPGSISSDVGQWRLFGQTASPANLYVHSTRRERYEAALLDIACLSDYRPEQIRAFQRQYLDNAPYAIRQSILYQVLTNYLAQSTTTWTNMAQLQSTFHTVGNIMDIIDDLDTIMSMPLPPANNVPPQVADFFPGVPYEAYGSSPEVWDSIGSWIKPFAEAAHAIQVIQVARDLGGSAFDIAVTAFWGQLMANDAAIARMDSIVPGLQADSGVWNDPALREAVTNVSAFLRSSKSAEAIQFVVQGLADHAADIISGAITLAEMLEGKAVLTYLAQIPVIGQLPYSVLGGWAIGVAALEQEFTIILGINLQLENAELSVCAATIGKTLCSATPGQRLLRVPAIYGYCASAKYLISAFSYEPLPFWNTGDTVDIWKGAQTYFESKLHAEYSTV